MHPRRRSPLRALTVACHRALGTCMFRAGAHERSRRQFERILELTGDDFGAYVHLALIAYRLGDYSSWQRECGHARRTDARRYAELRHPFELFEGSSEADSGDAQPWRRAFRVSRAGSDHDGSDHDGSDRDGSDRDGPAREPGHSAGAAEVCRRPTGDDFSTEAERERFRALDPLTVEDVRAADLDELVRQLGS